MVGEKKEENHTSVFFLGPDEFEIGSFSTISDPMRSTSDHFLTISDPMRSTSDHFLTSSGRGESNGWTMWSRFVAKLIFEWIMRFFLRSKLQ